MIQVIINIPIRVPEGNLFHRNYSHGQHKMIYVALRLGHFCPPKACKPQITSGYHRAIAQSVHHNCLGQIVDGYFLK